MSKIIAKVKVPKKRILGKAEHGNKMQCYIPSGMATPGPPLGPTLGLYNINIAAFCKDFNEKTKHMKEGIPLPVRVMVNPDRSYQLNIHQPTTVYFVKQAAGLQKATFKGEVAGKITLKHVYEIAKIKSQDRPLQIFDLQDVCKMVIGVARSCGIQVVRDLDPKEYQKFLEERKAFAEEYRKQLDELKESKMLRTV